MQNNLHYTDESTIDIRELFSILKKRKRLIYLITLFFTSAAIIYILLAKPVYEVNSMIEISQINDKPIANIEDLKQKLEYQYQVNNKNNKNKFPRVSSIAIPKKSKNILQIIVVAHSNKDAIPFIHTVTDNIEKKYKEEIDAYVNNQKELIALTQKNILSNTKNLNTMQSDIKKYNDKIISLKREDAALAGIYALQIGQKQSQYQKLQQYVSTLQKEEQRLKLSISSFKIKQTHVIGEVEMLDKPIKPKKILLLIGSFITGLVFSIFLIFLLSFIGEIKEED